MTFEQYREKLKKDLLQTTKGMNTTEEDIDKYLDKNINWIKSSFNRNSNSIEGIAYAMSLDFDFIE